MPPMERRSSAEVDALVEHWRHWIHPRADDFYKLDEVLKNIAKNVRDASSSPALLLAAQATVPLSRSRSAQMKLITYITGFILHFVNRISAARAFLAFRGDRCIT